MASTSETLPMSRQFPPNCDPEVYSKGASICSFHAAALGTEEWVKKVAALSGQRVDWHYFGGYANVLFLGVYDRVRKAVEQLAPQLVNINAECFRIYENEDESEIDDIPISPV